MSSEKSRLDHLWELYPTTFRNNVGQAYAGGKELKKGNDFIVVNPQRIKYGLGNGSGDLIGYSKVKITPEMVGQEVAIFTSIEDKSEKDKISQEQIIWLLRLRLDGAIAEVFREGQKLTLDEILELKRRDNIESLSRIIQRLCEQIGCKG